MRVTKNFLCAPVAVAAVALLALLSCASVGKDTPTESAVSPFASFRDIPGVTDAEIAAIEALLLEQAEFSFGTVLSTEAFLTDNGEIDGYVALVCRWLTELFGVPFTPAIHDWNHLVEGLLEREIDFSSELTPTAERRKTWAMSDDFAKRALKYMRIAGSGFLPHTSDGPRLRYAFLTESVTPNEISSKTLRPFEIVWVDNYADAYAALKNGSVDAFIDEATAEAAFDAYGDVVSEDFLPSIFVAVCLATANQKLEPIISVVTKALRNGAHLYLSNLYNQGYSAYKKHKFAVQLSDSEKEYLLDTDTVLLAARYFNYPVDFFNKYEHRWEGIVFDVLAEVENLTGLKFKVVNDTKTELSELFNMIYDGRAHIMPELLYSEKRAEYVIWTKHIFIKDKLALLSTSKTPNVSVNDIPSRRVGVIKNSVRAELFRSWFPSAANVIEYATDESAMFALASGEADLVMSSKYRLLSFIHLYDLPVFKANFLFNYPYESTFGFHKDQTALCSIMDKALPLVDTDMITDQWLTKTHDYKVRIMEAQRPWLVGSTALSLVILALILILFQRSRSERKRLAVLVAEQTEEVRRASVAKSRFIANMNHEMRTPMNVVVGLTDLMLEEDDVPDTLKKTLKKINTAGNNLMGLINDVLDISKIEAGRLELIPVQYDTASMLNDIITLNILRIEDKPITFKLDIDEHLPKRLYGDDLRVKQILNNILSNAFKYTRIGNVTLTVNCEHSEDSVWLAICISDTGIGIRKEDIDTLFSDYNQVDTRANRKIEGTGLGLSITKKMVEMMDGSITVESVYGKGTTFNIRIRQGNACEETIGKETAANLRGLRYQDNKKLAHERLVRAYLGYARVLVVDDFPTNLDVIAGMLRKYKMQVDCVDNGKDAVAHIANGEPRYDAIFMDHMMPEMDGIEATARIRALGTDYAENIPIIALTANAVAGNEQMFLDNGFNVFLPKPINVMILDSIVQRWVRDKSRE